jgi:3-deoxy-D-manno-octulosonate 8-phosphate phosphatase KdsC-like HAD superfamily phosphatase
VDDGRVDLRVALITRREKRQVISNCEDLGVTGRRGAETDRPPCRGAW